MGLCDGVLCHVARVGDRLPWCRGCAGARLGGSRQEVAVCHDDYDAIELPPVLPQGWCSPTAPSGNW